MIHLKNVPAVLLALLFWASGASAALNVFACEPELAALARTLGGDNLSVFSATRAGQDPHHIQARPSLIAKARRADLLVCTGAELEIGWLPLLLRKAANGRIQPGRAGHFLATEHVPLLGANANVDRSHGDVHAAGNPHVHLSPRNLATITNALTQTLAQLDPANRSDYEARLAHFQQAWAQAIKRWEAQTAHLRGKRVVVHHDSWPYLLQWLGLEQAATLEPKPGIPPSTGHLSNLVHTLQAQPAALIIRSDYQDGKASHWLSKQTGTPAVALPFTVDNDETLLAWMDRLLGQLVAAIGQPQ